MSSGGLTNFAKERPLLSFFVLTYALNAVAFGIQALYQFGILHLNEPVWYAIEALFSPAAAALIVHWLTERNLKVSRIWESRNRFVLALVLGPALILISAVVVPAILATKDPLHALNWRAFLSFSSYHCRCSGQYWGLFLGPLIEEPGWRGFALPRMQSIVGPGWSAILLGIAWAAWHFPGFLISGWTASAILRYSVVVVCLSVLMSLGANISRFSIMVAVVMHSVANTRGCLIERLASGAQERVHGALIWTLAAMLVPALVLFVTRGQLGAARVSMRAPD
jgi:membrane protease YdiL (CAAX protease family)